MKASSLINLSLLALALSSITIPSTGISNSADTNRRILHQPLYPEGSAPPPPPAEPPPPNPDIVGPDQPFFPEVPTGRSPDQTQTNSPPANVATPIQPQTQSTNPTKKMAIAVSVSISTLALLSALAFFLYRHRIKNPGESEKLFGANSRQFPPGSSTGAASDFLYLGTMEPTNGRSSGGGGEEPNSSPYHKLSSVRHSTIPQPSPELQPLPPLNGSAPFHNSVTAISSDDDTFYSPRGSVTGSTESPCTPVSRRSFPSNRTVKGGDVHTSNSTLYSRRASSPKSRIPNYNSHIKQATAPPPDPPLPPPPPPPPLPPPPMLPPDIKQFRPQYAEPKTPSPPKRKAKFPSPPSPPTDLMLPHLINDDPSVQEGKSSGRTPLPPPPPPPPPVPAMLRKIKPSEKLISRMPVRPLYRPQSPLSAPSASTKAEVPELDTEINHLGPSSEPPFSGVDSVDEAKPRLKPLHWDKVRASSDRAMVWDQLKSSSFKLDEDMIETLFVNNTRNPIPKEPTRRPVHPRTEQENRVLDPKKSQNIAILLRALNVTLEEVTEALLDGNPEGLGAELLETLVKMAPTKEEELKLRDYNGDPSKLGSAERFLKAVLDIPFAFKRVDAMLYRANFDNEVKYLRESFQTLEAACEELKNSRLFLKLLEAVLRTGNRMNVGTNRGDAKSFKLDTLLKLVDVKGTDGKTTLLHFVVQEIIRSEGSGSDPTHEDHLNKIHQKSKEDEFSKQGLRVVAGLSNELGSVKKAAGMDSAVLTSYLTKLETGLNRIKQVLRYEKANAQGKFFEAMRVFLNEANEEILGVKAEENKALSLVKEITEYFHGDAVKEEAHRLRIFMVVRDFLLVLDQVCKEVSKMQDRMIVGPNRSFRISSSVPLPVLSRFNNPQEESGGEDSSSP